MLRQVQLPITLSLLLAKQAAPQFSCVPAPSFQNTRIQKQQIPWGRSWGEASLEKRKMKFTQTSSPAGGSDEGDKILGRGEL